MRPRPSFLLLSSLTLAGAFVVGTPALAADEAGTPTRASLAPAGEGPGAQSTADRVSDTPRGFVKSETRSNARAGMLVPAGEATAPAGTATRNPDADNSLSPRTSTRSRADVKADTKEDAAARRLQPAADTPEPAGAPPKR